jgi:hypothetical protein
MALLTVFGLAHFRARQVIFAFAKVGSNVQAFKKSSKSQMPPLACRLLLHQMQVWQGSRKGAENEDR